MALQVYIEHRNPKRAEDNSEKKHEFRKFDCAICANHKMWTSEAYASPKQETKFSISIHDDINNSMNFADLSHSLAHRRRRKKSAIEIANANNAK